MVVSSFVSGSAWSFLGIFFGVGAGGIIAGDVLCFGRTTAEEAKVTANNKVYGRALTLGATKHNNNP